VSLAGQRKLTVLSDRVCPGQVTTTTVRNPNREPYPRAAIGCINSIALPGGPANKIVRLVQLGVTLQSNDGKHDSLPSLRANGTAEEEYQEAPSPNKRD
jgi:hypothetical protein